jgi:hypothetical protein
MYPSIVIKKPDQQNGLSFLPPLLQVIKGTICLPIGYNKDIFQAHKYPGFALNPQLPEITKKLIYNSQFPAIHCDPEPLF